MAYTPIPTLPSAPSRADSPSTFSADMDALLAALPGLVSGINTMAAYLDALATAVDADAATASAASQAAVGGAGATIWVTGTTYAIGDVRWSPSTYLSYRRKTAGAGSTDPASDSTNWAALTSGGDVTQTGSQTLTNKTMTDPAITGAIKEDEYTIPDGGSVDIDPGNGTIQFWTLGANRTPTAANFANGESVTLFIADGTAYAVTWSTIGVVWAGGAAPTLPTTGYGWIVLTKNGGVVRGAYNGAVAS